MPVSIISQPREQVDTGFYSTWNGLGTPIIWKFQRKDYTLTSAPVTGGGKVKIQILGNHVSEMTIGHTVYINQTGKAEGITTITGNITFTGTHTEADTGLDDVAGAFTTGFVNLNTFRLDYEMKVWLITQPSGDFVLETFAKPDRTGLLTFDAAPWIRSRLTARDFMNYGPADFSADTQGCYPYNLMVGEKYGAVETTPSQFGVSTHYAVLGSRQIGDQYGGNMGQNLAFTVDLDEDKKAKFLTVFERPTYFEGYPFQLSWLQSAGDGTTVTQVTTGKDINGNDTTGSPQNTNYLPATWDYINRMALSFVADPEICSFETYLNTGAVAFAGLTTTSNNCGFMQVAATNSQLADGTPITSGTPAATCMLRYRFGGSASPLWIMEIAPDEDATDAANWDYISGSKSEAQFDAEILPFISGGSNGFSWGFNHHKLAIENSINSIDVALSINEGTPGPYSTQTLSWDPVSALTTGTTTKSGNFDFYFTLNQACQIFVKMGSTEEVVATSVGSNLLRYSVSGTTDFEFWGNVNHVTGINCQSMNMTAFVPNVNLPNLDTININNNQVASQIDLSGYSNLLTFDADNNDIPYLNIGSLPNVTRIWAQNNSIANAQNISSCPALTSFRMNSNLIPSLTIGTLNNLTYLHVASNSIANGQDISNLPVIQTCYINHNQIPTLVVGTTATLQYFYFMSNNIVSPINVSGYTGLIDLRGNDNSVPTFTLGTHSVMATCWMYNNSIAGTVDISNCSFINSLRLENNSITTLTKGAHTNLWTFYANNNSIAGTLDISGDTALRDIRVNDNSLTALTVGTHASMITLWAHNNSIAGTVDISNCTALVNLNLSNNSITVITGGAISTLTQILVQTNSIGASDISDLVDSFYPTPGTGAGTGKNFQLQGNSVPDADAIAKLDGTGAYSGAGFVDNGWSIVRDT